MITRAPTAVELAAALRYIEIEFIIDDGLIHGDQWAEGLAFWRYTSEESRHAEDIQLIRPQMSDLQWRVLAAAADRLRADQGEAPRYVERTP